MSTGGSFALRLREALEPRLRQFADAVTSCAPSTSWHIEFPNSRAYEFDTLLVFGTTKDPTDEVIVVSITFRRIPEVIWTIDAVDRESLPLMEVRDLSVEQQVEMASDPNIAAGVLARLLDRYRNLLTSELTNAVR